MSITIYRNSSALIFPIKLYLVETNFHIKTYGGFEHRNIPCHLRTLTQKSSKLVNHIDSIWLFRLFIISQKNNIHIEHTHIYPPHKNIPHLKQSQSSNCAECLPNVCPAVVRVDSVCLFVVMMMSSYIDCLAIRIDE